MHEITIATSLIELASEHALREGSARVTSLYVRLGAMCGIARSLYFCFGPATRGTACEGAVLHIEEVPVTIFCHRCQAACSPLTIANLCCPHCGTRSREVRSGREMELTHIEVESRPEYA